MDLKMSVELNGLKTLIQKPAGHPLGVTLIGGLSLLPDASQHSSCLQTMWARRPTICNGAPVYS